MKYLLNHQVLQIFPNHGFQLVAILEYKNFIKKNFDYVGENFAYEARSIHYENKKTTRGVYGKASKGDLKELNEEGIKVEIMPWIKNTTN